MQAPDFARGYAENADELADPRVVDGALWELQKFVELETGKVVCVLDELERVVANIKRNELVTERVQRKKENVRLTSMGAQTIMSATDNKPHDHCWQHLVKYSSRLKHTLKLS